MNGNVDMQLVDIDREKLLDELGQAFRYMQALGCPLVLQSLDRFSGLRLELQKVKVQRLSRRPEAIVAVIHDELTDKWVRLLIPDQPAQAIVARGSFGELAADT